MNLLSLITLGLFGNKKRSISDIVETFTTVRTELQSAVEEAQEAIDTAALDKAKADAVAEEAIKTAEARAFALIAKAKADAKASQSKALEKQAKVIEAGIAEIKTAKASINVANQWIAKIPSID